MTLQQTDTLLRLLAELLPTEFHHGLCEGSDVEAHDCCRMVRGADCHIIGHPGPDDDSHRRERTCDEMRPPLTHFARNRNIVAACERLIATPWSMSQLEHGGTWYTIWHAQKKGVPVTIIWPDGSVEDGA